MRVLLVCLMGLVSAAAWADDDTKSRLEQGEVIVTTRAIAGSSLPEVHAQGVIDAPPEKLWAILQDCGNYQKTMQRVARSKELSRAGNKVVCEVEIGLPFPLSNLVGVTEATHTVTATKWVRAWHLLRGDYEVNDGSWTLTRYNDDPKRTLAEYKLHAIPKSNVPDAILKKGQRKAIPDLFQHLREITK